MATNYEITQLSAIAAGRSRRRSSCRWWTRPTRATPPAGSAGSNKQMTLEPVRRVHRRCPGGGDDDGLARPERHDPDVRLSIAVNAALGNVFAVTLTASTGTLANPTNATRDGQPIRVRVIQDGTGGRTLAYGTAWDFGAAGRRR